jgi:hypothetical protein
MQSTIVSETVKPVLGGFTDRPESRHSNHSVQDQTLTYTVGNSDTMQCSTAT